MLMRTDPFREFDRLTQQLLAQSTRPAAMPMDAYRTGESFVIHFDIPGVARDTIDLTVEQNVLTVHAERRALVENEAETVVSERPTGTFTRQLFLGESLDTDQIHADYLDGVLTLTIPVKAAAKPRRVEIAAGDNRQITAA